MRLRACAMLRRHSEPELWVLKAMADELKKCPACAEVILAEAKKCKHCGEIIDASLLQTQIVQSAPTRAITWNPGTAALLSFFIAGAGQIYKGQVGKGILVFFFCVFLIVGVVTVPFAGVVWLMNIYDAYSAKA